ncbi:MAG: 50S ribosomal protein L10 [Patescibacteria group bacterium]
MPQTKEQKQKTIEDLIEKIKKQKTMLFIDFTGLKVKEFSDLRKKMKQDNNEVKVAKKTLLDLAFKKAGLKIETKNLKGEIALVFGFQDEISPAKITYQFSQAHPNLKILGGFFYDRIIEAERIVELAKLPTREEILARLAGTILAPVSNFVRALEFNLKGLINVLAKAKN